MYILEINWAWETSIWNFPQLSTSFYCKDLVLDEFPCRSCDADNIETWSRSSMARTGCLSHDGMAGWNWMKLLHKKRNHMENKTRKTLNRSIKSIHISHQHSRPNPADFMRLQGQHLVCVQLVKFTSGVNCDRITRSMLRRIWRRVLRSEVIGLCLLLGRNTNMLLLSPFGLYFETKFGWFTSANHAKQAGWPLKPLRQDTWWTFHILRAFEFKWIQRLESEFTFMIAWSQTWLYASLPFRQRACNVVNTDSNGWKLDSGWRLVVRNIQTQISRLDKHMAYMDLTEYTYNSKKPYHQFQLPRTRSHAHQPCMWDAFKKCTTILLQNFIVIHRYTLYT